ncbi:MAG TPA: AMMECR1 family protein, partial [Synergistales bacterium]|nr:AMMECR1 family protein [Synergistales bacterium]
TISPVKSSLGEEIISNAIAAAVQDPRFPPLSGDELSHVTISVNILSPPQQINGADELNPSEFGVIIEKDLKRSVLLPDLDGITTVEQQLAIASRKAGICSLRGATIYKFTVSRYTETH